MRESESTTDIPLEPWCNFCGKRHGPSTALCSVTTTSAKENDPILFAKAIEWDGPPTFHSRVRFE